MPTGEARYHANGPFTGPGSPESLRLNCEASASDDFALWDNITSFVEDFDHTDILSRADASASIGLVNRFCVGAGCGAYSEGAYAAAYCVGDYCALASFGDYAGYACVGVNCAARTHSGCRTTLFSGNDQSCDPSNGYCYPENQIDLSALSSTANFDACCASNQGSGCLMHNCSRACTGESCAEYCIGDNCGRGCEGNQCASNCQSNHCGRDCVGNKCAMHCTCLFLAPPPPAFSRPFFSHARNKPFSHTQTPEFSRAPPRPLFSHTPPPSFSHTKTFFLTQKRPPLFLAQKTLFSHANKPAQKTQATDTTALVTATEPSAGPRAREPCAPPIAPRSKPIPIQPESAANFALEPSAP